jgi:serine/threonine protein phosphatase PrpC
MGENMNILRRIIKRADPPLKQREVNEMSLPQPEIVSLEAAYLQPSSHDLQIGMASDPGRVRERNEDASLVWQYTLAQHGQSPLTIGLFIIADGMGGHVHGEQASALSVRLAAEHVVRHVCLPTLAEDDAGSERVPINEILEESVRLANQGLIRRMPDAGTTLTMALVLGDGVYIAHVGDSRVYLGERGSLQLLTQDHSLAARLVETGSATPEEVTSQRNMLYKALGQGIEIEPDILYCDLEVGQYLLLCCDGLWGKVQDEEIAATVEAASTPDLACQHLVTRANENGGEDNISVILVARGWPLSMRRRAGEQGIGERGPRGKASSE